jgi:hypothetical protein
MDISRHIAELLYRHDCVVVPGLGGFILRERPGQRLSGIHQFTPPSREVSFNSLLGQDDGLLISFVAKSEGITYDFAKAHVANFVKEVTDTLDTGKEVKLEGMGTLGYSAELKLVFRPLPGLNFLESSYGLAPVIAQPLSQPKRSFIQERKIKPRADRKPIRSKEKTPASVKWTMAVSVPVILFLLWGIIFPASFQDTYTNYSGMLSGIFENSEPVIATPVVIPSPSASETAAIKEPETSITAQEPVLVPVTKQEPAPVELKYHVIAGVFRSQENAERYVACLEDRGFDSRMVGIDRAGRYRVSFNSFESQDKAEEYLKYIKVNENPAAWILNY